MANWVKCTRKADSAPIYLNLDTAMTLRWNDAEAFTVVGLPGGPEQHVRVLEHPDDLFIGDRSSADPNIKEKVKSKR
jgi:hypothetical protein